MNPLNLTFIPANYWNEPLVNFSVMGKGKSPPKPTGFFLFWINDNDSEVDLVKSILRYFPSIPALKLATCHINLVQPIQFMTPSGEIQAVGQVLGKIVPIPPLIKILFDLVIIESKDRTHKITRYSDSVKVWAYLTKFTIELLIRGNFVPILEQTSDSLSHGNENTYIGKWQVILKTCKKPQKN